MPPDTAVIMASDNEDKLVNLLEHYQLLIYYASATLSDSSGVWSTVTVAAQTAAAPGRPSKMSRDVPWISSVPPKFCKYQPQLCDGVSFPNIKTLFQ